MSSQWTRGLVAAVLLMTVALPASTRGPLARPAAAGVLAPTAGPERLAIPADPNDGDADGAEAEAARPTIQ